MVLKGEAEFVGNDEYKADVYILNGPTKTEEEDSTIL
jgi:hypothetical protein